jgi:hypothetical protein
MAIVLLKKLLNMHFCSFNLHRYESKGPNTIFKTINKVTQNLIDYFISLFRLVADCAFKACINLLVRTLSSSGS